MTLEPNREEQSHGRYDRRDRRDTHLGSNRDLPPPRKCRATRIGAGLSPDKMGSALGVSGVTVGRWENGTASLGAMSSSPMSGFSVKLQAL